jgi:DNA-binding XRE family transcriptional regulator
MATRVPRPHVLRTTRHLYRLSQAKMAAKVGVKPITIKSIEAGKLRPSPYLAYLIFQQTALDPQQLITNSEPESPRNTFGEPLNPDEMNRLRQARQPRETQQQVDANVRNFSALLTLVLDASAREGKLWAIRPALAFAIDKIMQSFNLTADVDKLLRERWGLSLKQFGSSRNPFRSLTAIASHEGNDSPKNQKTREHAAKKRDEFFERLDLRHNGIRQQRSNGTAPHSRQLAARVSAE